MKKHVCLLLLIISSSISYLSAQPSETKKPQAYALGVSMGFASFQASVALGENKVSEMHKSYIKSQRALLDVKKYLSSINSAINILDTLQFYHLERESNIPLRWDDERDSEYIKGYLKRYYNNILTIREKYTVQLSKYSSNLANAYALGVNIAIAEGQANVGEATREIVYTALNNAKTSAKSLQLDTTVLNDIILNAAGTTPMPDIYYRLVALRANYQESL